MKLSYNSRLKMYTIQQFNPDTKRVEVIDSSPDCDVIAIKHGFVSQEKEDEEFELLADEEK